MVGDDEMVGWYHQLKGREFEQTLGDSEDRGAWPVEVHGILGTEQKQY